MSNELTHDSIEALVADYIRAWSTPEASTRSALVSAVYAADADFFSAEDGDLRLTGRGPIAENIGQVNERDIQGNGLAIVHTGTTVNHRMVRVTWQMVTPDGTNVLSGMNVLVLNHPGQIVEDHIFIG